MWGPSPILSDFFDVKLLSNFDFLFSPDAPWSTGTPDRDQMTPENNALNAAPVSRSASSLKRIESQRGFDLI